MLKNTVTRIFKMLFHELINRLDKAEERVFRLENMTTEISKNEKQRERKIGKEKNRISKNCGQLQKI